MIYRRRYPDALICTTCGMLLATRPESYAKSTLSAAAGPCGASSPDRLTYVCAGCRIEAAEAAKNATIKAETGRRNLALARAAKSRIGAGTGHTTASVESPLNEPSVSNDLRACFDHVATSGAAPASMRITGRRDAPPVAPTARESKAPSRDPSARLRGCDVSGSS